MNILLEQLHLHIGGMRHLADITRAQAVRLSPTELMQAEKLADQAGWLQEDIIQSLGEAVEKSTIPEPSTPA